MKLKMAGMLEGEKWLKTQEHCRRVYRPDGLCPTITGVGGRTGEKGGSNGKREEAQG